VTRGEKWKFEASKPTVPTKRVKKHYRAKQKGDYTAKMAGERRVKKKG